MAAHMCLLIHLHPTCNATRRVALMIGVIRMVSRTTPSAYFMSCRAASVTGEPCLATTSAWQRRQDTMQRDCFKSNYPWCCGWIEPAQSRVGKVSAAVSSKTPPAPVAGAAPPRGGGAGAERCVSMWSCWCRGRQKAGSAQYLRSGPCGPGAQIRAGERMSDQLVSRCVYLSAIGNGCHCAETFTK